MSDTEAEASDNQREERNQKLLEVSGHLTSLKLLLDAGGDPDLKDEYGRTALTLAAMDNCPEIVSELLRRGANEKIEYNGKSAQKWAEKQGHQDVVKIFQISNNKEN